MAYAAIEDVKAKTTRSFSQEEETVLETLLEDAAVMIDAFAPDADSAAKKQSGSCNNQRKSQLPDLSSVIYLVSFLEFSHTICK